MITRRRVIALATAPLAALAVAALPGCGGRPWPSLEGRVTIATGNRGGVFVRYGHALATVIDTRLDGVSATTRATDASLENLRLVADGTCDLGFSLGDAASEAHGAGIDVAALARMYDSYVHLVVRADSPFRRAADLQGRRIGVGAQGSGTRVIAERVLERAGVRAADATLDGAPLAEAARRLRTGSLDAFFFVSGLPNAAIATLARSLPLRLLDLDAFVTPLVATYGPQYARAAIPPSVYQMAAPVGTVSVKNYLLVHPGASDDLAYAITRIVFEEQEAIDRVEPGVVQPTFGAAIYTAPIPLHAGALRYYRERDP